MSRDHALQKAIGALGAANKLARELGITPQALSQWRRAPADRVIDIERITGIPREELRPDLYAPRPEQVSA